MIVPQSTGWRGYQLADAVMARSFFFSVYRTKKPVKEAGFGMSRLGVIDRLVLCIVENVAC
jgi:hypothetical protein